MQLLWQPVNNLLLLDMKTFSISRILVYAQLLSTVVQGLLSPGTVTSKNKFVD